LQHIPERYKQEIETLRSICNNLGATLDKHIYGGSFLDIIYKDKNLCVGPLPTRGVPWNRHDSIEISGFYHSQNMPPIHLNNRVAVEEAIADWIKTVDKKIISNKKAAIRRKKRKLAKSPPGAALVVLMDEYFNSLPGWGAESSGQYVYIYKNDQKPQTCRCEIVKWRSTDQDGSFIMSFGYIKHSMVFQKKYDIIPANPKWDPNIFCKEIESVVDKYYSFIRSIEEDGWKDR